MQAMRTWEPQRQVSTGSIGTTGHWPSAKMGRQIAYESKLEHDFLELLETYDDVVFFLEQPLKIPYATQAGTDTYYPDLLLVLNDGRAVVVEIKPPQGMAMRHNWLKWSAMRAYCDEAGYGFLVTDGRKSIQQVGKAEVRPQVRQQVLDALHLGPLDWQQYKALRRTCSIKTPELYTLIIKERLHWQPRPFRLEKTELPRTS